MDGRAQALGGGSPPPLVGGDLKAFPPAPSSPFSMERIQTCLWHVLPDLSHHHTDYLSRNAFLRGAPKGLVGQLEERICCLVQHPWMGALLVSENPLAYAYIWINAYWNTVKTMMHRTFEMCGFFLLFFTPKQQSRKRLSKDNCRGTNVRAVSRVSESSLCYAVRSLFTHNIHIVNYASTNTLQT